LERNECVFEPKLINNLQNIISICSSTNNTYFLSNDGNIYFCGEYYDKNNSECFQLLPQIIKSDLIYKSLHSIDCYQKQYPIGCAINCIHSLNFNVTEKTNYKTLEEFYSNECQMTYKTYYLKLQSDIKDKNLQILGIIILFYLNII